MTAVIATSQIIWPRRPCQSRARNTDSSDLLTFSDGMRGATPSPPTYHCCAPHQNEAIPRVAMKLAILVTLMMIALIVAMTMPSRIATAALTIAEWPPEYQVMNTISHMPIDIAIDRSSSPAIITMPEPMASIASQGMLWLMTPMFALSR
jgi:hypothetical protein